MVEYAVILGIALANNLDNVGVGIAYGLQGVRICPLTNSWIALLGFVITAAAGEVGLRTGTLLTQTLLKVFSGGTLCVIGLWFLWGALREKAGQHTAIGSTGASENSLSADVVGQERRLGWREATVLGLALAVNNIGGGFSVGLMHHSVLATALFSALFSYLALWMGSWLRGSRRIRGITWLAPIAAGMLLLAIGIEQIL